MYSNIKYKTLLEHCKSTSSKEKGALSYNRYLPHQWDISYPGPKIFNLKPLKINLGFFKTTKWIKGNFAKNSIILYTVLGNR